MSLAELETYRALSIDERLRLGQALARRLGGDFQATEELIGDFGLLVLHHVPTQRQLAFIPGGAFEMGLRDADLDELAELVDWTPEVDARIAVMKRVARPVRRVRVRPFLCDPALMRKRDLLRLTGDASARKTIDREGALRVVASLGFRLPSEAELEYLARGGGPFAFVDDGGRIWSETGRWPEAGPFGVSALSIGEWAADDYHSTYEGAPPTSDPWMAGEACGVFRGELPIGPDQHPSELLYGLAAHRNHGARASDRDHDHAFFQVRLALSVTDGDG